MPSRRTELATRRTRWLLAVAAIVAAALLASANVEPVLARLTTQTSLGGNAFTTASWSYATVTASADTYLATGSANANQGGQSTMEVNPNRRVLVQFDNTAIATAIAGKTVVGAVLRLNRTGSTSGWGTTGRPVDVHRVLTAWTELGTTWNCPVDTNTGNSQPDCASQWNGGSYTATPTASVVHLNSTTGWVEWTVTADVQSMIATPANNFGWLIKKTDEGTTGTADYSTRESGPNVAQLVLTLT